MKKAINRPYFLVGNKSGKKRMRICIRFTENTKKTVSETLWKWRKCARSDALCPPHPHPSALLPSGISRWILLEIPPQNFFYKSKTLAKPRGGHLYKSPFYAVKCFIWSAWCCKSEEKQSRPPIRVSPYVQSTQKRGQAPMTVTSHVVMFPNIVRM